MSPNFTHLPISIPFLFELRSVTLEHMPYFTMWTKVNSTRNSGFIESHVLGYSNDTKLNDKLLALTARPFHPKTLLNIDMEHLFTDWPVEPQLSPTRDSSAAEDETDFVLGFQKGWLRTPTRLQWFFINGAIFNWTRTKDDSSAVFPWHMIEVRWGAKRTVEELESELKRRGYTVVDKEQANEESDECNHTTEMTDGSGQESQKSWWRKVLLCESLRVLHSD